MTDQRGPDPHPLLVWLFEHSAAEVGLHAQGIPETDVPHGEPQGPTAEQMKAARKQRRLRGCVNALKPLHRNVLGMCYAQTPPDLPRNYVSALGVPLAKAAYIIERAEAWDGGAKLSPSELGELCKVVSKAHECFCSELERDRLERLALADRTSRVADVDDAVEPYEGEPLIDLHEQDLLRVCAEVRSWFKSGIA